MNTYYKTLKDKLLERAYLELANMINEGKLNTKIDNTLSYQALIYIEELEAELKEVNDY